MKTVAFISDIHSNLPALKSTIKDIRDRGINTIYCLGDIIGYHSFTNEVIDLLQQEDVISIKGNHDIAITGEYFNRDNDGDFVLYWNFDALTSENREYLNNLPSTLEFIIEGITLKLVHGSPKSADQYIREESDEADLYLKEMKTDILICAHTHIPYIRSLKGKHLLNTGSIGKPKFGKPLCSYLLLNIDGNNINPEIITLSYPVKVMTEHLKKNKFPEKLITALETGNP
ncbi:MAG: metallophosphatase family protein [Spirochaetaceae bacterium]